MAEVCVMPRNASQMAFNNEIQTSSSSVDSSGYNSYHCRKDNCKENKENNVKESPCDMKSFNNVDDQSNLTDLSPLLTCIRSLNGSDAIWNENASKCLKSISLKQLKNENDVPREDGFYFAVSLRDGLCLFTSSAITNHLGYPKDMLNGQCFMNFVFQKDHITFANHLTQSLNACFIQGERDETHLVVNSFFCRLSWVELIKSYFHYKKGEKQIWQPTNLSPHQKVFWFMPHTYNKKVYQGLKYGYILTDRKIEYKPFKITLHLNELIIDDMCVEKSPATLCVQATSTAVSSAYSIPEEIPAMTSFSTRHTASCHFSHVDFSAIPYLGYLPQDMIGMSVFKFYHTDDMPHLKDIYELVVKEHGSSFRSKPYRFKVQNGCYIMLETEWSCFINPWSHKLEFVVGQHRVLNGPTNVDIFNEPEFEENLATDEIAKESQKIQKEIKTILSQPMKNVVSNKSRRFCNKRKRDLASFVFNCIDEGYGGNENGKSDKQDIADNRSNSDPDSVVMGDISPYRDVNDSSVSSETPPNVQQLRYQENIERFFASQPKTYSDGSDESNKHEKSSSGDDYQGSTSGSGNGSGNTSNEPSTTNKYGNKMQQESSSNSSKCNMSSFTTRDSGFKSLESDNRNIPSNSQAWEKNTGDSVNKTNEKFSSCLALTEETLSAHNRINHKYLKQHQRKSKSMVHSKDNCFQSKDLTHGKHKKCSHNHLTISTPTQTDINFTSSQHIPFFVPQSSTPATSTDPKTMSTHLPQVPYSCLIPPSTYSSAAPTPLFIPVVYMSSVPYYPPISTVHPQNGSPFWPCPSSAPAKELPTPSFPFPVISACSHHGGVMPSPTMGYPTFPLTNFNPFSGIPFGVQSSGVTATSLSTTTTTTVASEGMHTFTNSLNANEKSGLHKKVNSMKKTKHEVNECDMLVDDTLSSSFTQSSSLQSVEKEEDMDFEIKKCHPRPHSEKVELSPEIAFRYQMDLPNINEVLKKDLEALKSMQQPELINKQLQILHSEFKNETENKPASKNDFCTTEQTMLGMTIEENVNESVQSLPNIFLEAVFVKGKIIYPTVQLELEYREECLLQLMCEDS